ncbi:hypothetical protein [Parazoarcus communis]|uniref:hypothetical protein n=1 Tax=Parazoarcus communis TaxID=41977 RepID=UPI00131F3149|nr:hypothetical protein [Parazoarcus communis]
MFSSLHAHANRNDGLHTPRWQVRTTDREGRAARANATSATKAQTGIHSHAAPLGVTGEIKLEGMIGQGKAVRGIATKPWSGARWQARTGPLTRPACGSSADEVAVHFTEL